MTHKLNLLAAITQPQWTAGFVHGGLWLISHCLPNMEANKKLDFFLLRSCDLWSVADSHPRVNRLWPGAAFLYLDAKLLALTAYHQRTLTHPGSHSVTPSVRRLGRLGSKPLTQQLPSGARSVGFCWLFYPPARCKIQTFHCVRSSWMQS